MMMMRGKCCCSDSGAAFQEAGIGRDGAGAYGPLFRVEAQTFHGTIRWQLGMA